MTYSDDYLQAAYDEHSWHNRSEIEASDQCGCFSCFATFPASSVWDWIPSEQKQETAACPYCQIDAVLGDLSGLPVTEQNFLRALNKRVFDGPPFWDQVADPHPISTGPETAR